MIGPNISRSAQFTALPAAMLALMLFAPGAGATLIGDTVDCDISSENSGWTCSPTSAEVDGGVEFTLNLSGLTVFSVDIGESSIHLQLETTSFEFGAEERVTISSLDWLDFPSGEIVGFMLTVQGPTGIADGDISFDAHSVSILLHGSDWLQDDVIWIDLITNHRVLEPGTLAIFGFGLLGLGLARRRGKTA